MGLGEALGARGDTVARHLLSPERPDHGQPAAWIVDEASLLSARDTARLFDLADKHDARIILVGDVKQLGSVEAGAAFAQLQSAGKIGRASVGKECVSTCRSRWSPYH